MKKQSDKEQLFERFEKIDPTFKRKLNEEVDAEEEITVEPQEHGEEQNRQIPAGADCFENVLRHHRNKKVDQSRRRLRFLSGGRHFLFGNDDSFALLEQHGEIVLRAQVPLFRGLAVPSRREGVVLHGIAAVVHPGQLILRLHEPLLGERPPFVERPLVLAALERGHAVVEVRASGGVPAEDEQQRETGNPQNHLTLGSARQEPGGAVGRLSCEIV